MLRRRAKCRRSVGIAIENRAVEYRGTHECSKRSAQSSGGLDILLRKAWSESKAKGKDARSRVTSRAPPHRLCSLSESFRDFDCEFSHQNNQSLTASEPSNDA
jgi:hypothetical protein